VLLFIIGLLSGMIGGMGIGGGTILIPSIIFFAGITQHAAQGINLVSFIPTAIAAILIHARNKHVRFRLAFHLILAGISGAVIGSVLASYMSGSVLRRMFGIYLLVMGVHEMLRKGKG